MPNDITPDAPSTEELCACPIKGIGKEYACDDAKATAFPSHCPCRCHKQLRVGEKDRRVSKVVFHGGTRGNVADRREAMEREGITEEDIHETRNPSHYPENH